MSYVARLTNISTRLPLGKYFVRLHCRIYRWSSGRVCGTYFGAPVLLLETVGRRSGLPRETAVIYLLDGDTPIVLASNAGASTPNWWLNLRAAGTGWVRTRGDRYQVRARELAGEERTRQWAAFRAMYPAIDDYRSFTTREIPLVALERVG